MYNEKNYYLFIDRLKLSTDWTRRISVGWMVQGVCICVCDIGGFHLPVFFKKVLLSFFFPSSFPLIRLHTQTELILFPKSVPNN